MLQILAPWWPALVRVDHFLFYLWSKRPLGSFEFQMAPNLIPLLISSQVRILAPAWRAMSKRRFSTTLRPWRDGVR
jgi:hypothetical protein